jgi:hypothetical protein
LSSGLILSRDSNTHLIVLMLDSLTPFARFSS